MTSPADHLAVLERRLAQSRRDRRPDGLSNDEEAAWDRWADALRWAISEVAEAERLRQLVKDAHPYLNFMKHRGWGWCQCRMAAYSYMTPEEHAAHVASLLRPSAPKGVEP